MELSGLLPGPEGAPGLWLLCGPPASGKSSFRRGWWQGAVVSPDELRLAMHGATFDRRREGLVWMRVRREVRRLLAARRPLLLDATNLRVRDRRPWVAAAIAGGVPAYAVVCWEPGQMPVEELLRRNARRPEPVPEEQVRRMAAAWQPPAASEGFTGVWTIVGGLG